MLLCIKEKVTVKYVYIEVVTALVSISVKKSDKSALLGIYILTKCIRYDRECIRNTILCILEVQLCNRCKRCNCTVYINLPAFL